MRFNLQLVQLVGKFLGLFLSHCLGHSCLYFYLHACLLGFVSKACPWRACVCLVRATAVEVVQLFGSQGLWQHQVLSVMLGSRNIVL